MKREEFWLTLLILLLLPVIFFSSCASTKTNTTPARGASLLGQHYSAIILKCGVPQRSAHFMGVYVMDYLNGDCLMRFYICGGYSVKIEMYAKKGNDFELRGTFPE